MARAGILFGALALHVLGLCSAAQDITWNEWTARYGKSYATEREETTARLTWLKNKQLIAAHNREFNQGRQSYQMSLNSFADQNTDARGRPPIVNANLLHVSDSTRTSGGAPSSWDWRKKGKVNSVRNQGQIDSAEAIDAADAVASFSAIHSSTQLYNLSIQEVVDCCLPDPLYDVSIFACIKLHMGLCQQGDYHTGTSPNVCNNASCKAVASPKTGGEQVPSGDEEALADAVVFTPVMVAVDASQTSFQLYQSGIYDDPTCSSIELDHVLIVVGYGTDASGVEFWICRNTWGTSWGMDGYINIVRGKNMCGLATMPIYPD